MRRPRKPLPKPDMPIAPMIDCVFLMLVYFMTTSSLEKSEAELAFPSRIPGLPSDPLPAVDEQVLILDEHGAVLWNGTRFPLHENGGSHDSLKDRLVRFRETCRLAESEPSLRLLPEPKAPHQALVRLLDAISDARIETFHLP